MGVLGKKKTKDQQKRYNELFKHKLANNKIKTITQDVKLNEEGEDESDAKDRAKVSKQKDKA